MSATVEKRPLGKEGLEYLRYCLNYGRTLSEQVLEQFDLEEGELSVYVPEHVSIEESLEFKWGGKFDVERTWDLPEEGVNVEAVSCQTDPVVKEISLHLSQSPDNICILEDLIQRPSKWFLLFKKRMRNYIFLNKEVYLFLQPEHADFEKILDTIYDVRAMPVYNIFLTSFPRGEAIRLRPYQDISKTLTQQFATNTVKIFSLVYDGESFVVWEKILTLII
jgi:hypothetical protein